MCVCVVVVFDTFVEQMSTKELVAVLGHEIGHWAYGHVLQNFLITQIYVLCAFMAFGSFVNSPDLYHAFGFAQMPTVIGLMLFFAPLAGLLLDRPGSLPTVLTFAGGGVVIGVSLLAASYAESFAVVAVCFAFAGLGLSCCGPHSATIVQV